MCYYRVALQDTTTGETRWYTDATRYVSGQGEFDYCWEEGNFSCDCNRGHFFALAGGEPDPNLPCGDGRFQVVDYTLVEDDSPLDAPETCS